MTLADLVAHRTGSAAALEQGAGDFLGKWLAWTTLRHGSEVV